MLSEKEFDRAAQPLTIELCGVERFDRKYYYRI